MKRLLTAAALGLVMAGSAMAGDPIVGVWKTSVDDGRYAHVRFTECGAAICGTIIKAFNANGQYDSPNVGRKLFLDMRPQGDGTYKGSAWRPANGKIYKGSMTLNGNSLKAGGCVAGGLICVKNNLTRIK